MFVKQGVQFWRCVSCSFEFVNPRPSRKRLTDQYNLYGSQLFLDERRLRTEFDASRFDVEWDLIAKRSGRLLDVGCSTGAFVKLAMEAGFDAEGIDLSEPAISYGRMTLGLPLRCGDFTAHDFPASGYDIVTLWATLEHLPDPGAFVGEAHRVLRDSGVLALSVPNHSSATQRVLGQRNRYVGADHLNYFTRRSLTRLVERYGFRVDEMRTRKLNPYILFRDLRRNPSEGATVNEVIGDQSVTDNFKQAAIFAPLRMIHSIAERSIGHFGLGDLLLLRASK